MNPPSFSGSHAPAWEPSLDAPASWPVVNTRRWRVVTALPRWRVGTRTLLLFRKFIIGLLSLIIVACTASMPKSESVKRDRSEIRVEQPPSPQIQATNQSVVPLSQQKPLLPHDGLFIRRNNEFGSKYITGFKELVEQGELVDHKTIRWDDFIASNSDKIPAPTRNKAMSISHGISPIPSKSKHDARATHYLEIALKAPSSINEQLSKAEKLPANYIFVIDTSGSMQGQKLDMVKSAVAKLFLSLKETDVIGIIAFSNKTQTILKATPVADITPEDFSEVISGLTAKGGTDVNTGLSFGFEEISRYGTPYSVNQVFLFSDGNPTSGETNWRKIRQNITKKAKDNTKLSLFAFGTDANIRELNALAGVTGGVYTFVTQPDDVHFALNKELKRRDEVAAINVQMQIFIKPNIDIVHIFGHDLVTDQATRAAILDQVEATKTQAKQEYGVESQEDLVTKDKGIRIFVPNLSAGETYWVVLELATGQNVANFGTATVQYVDTFARQNKKQQFALDLQGKIPSDLVAEHGTGLWTSEVIFYAIDDLYEGDINTFKKRIENHIKVLENVGLKLRSSYIADDKIVLGKFLSLADNLGKVNSGSDEDGAQQVTMRSLNTFGRLRNGFVQP